MSSNMYLDTAITPTRHAFFVKFALIIITLTLMALAGVAWWAYVGVLAVSLLCWWLDSAFVPVYELSAHQADDIWYLGMYDDDEREVWQAYLQGAERVGRAIKLSFYVVVPYEMPYHLVVYRHSLSDDDFAKLSALSWARF